jgi:hypothetical protein
MSARARYEPASRTLTCPDCAAIEEPLLDETARTSATREYDRRRAAREQHVSERLGRFGVALVPITEEPQSTRA